MIPSLPPPGGTMSHADLMGRPRNITPAARGPPPAQQHHSRRAQTNGPGSSFTSASLDGHGPPPSTNNSRSSPGPGPGPGPVPAPPFRPGMGLRRVSSFSGPSGNRAGVGAVYNDLPAQSLPPRRPGRRGSIIGPTPPALVQASSSSSSSSVSSHNGSTRDTGGSVPSTIINSPATILTPRPRMKHQRTASESTVSTITRPSVAHASTSGPTPISISIPVVPKDPSSLPDGSIRLGQPDQKLEIGRLIGALHALTPPTRVRITPSSQANILHPSYILTPFAITLEALVTERSILLTPDQSSSDLPKLKDGSSLLLPDPGSGEIDWTTLKVYIRSLGAALDQILPYIQTSRDEMALEDIIRSIRMFVGKIKKVFSEVVQHYGDKYGFMKGLWDDKSMKSCAGEIGRWCDLFDV